MQPHWVGDLTLTDDPGSGQGRGPSGSVRLELVKGGAAHRCTIDVETGEAVVTRGETELGPVADADQGAGDLSPRVRQR